jgi:hypothetical protein
LHGGLFHLGDGNLSAVLRAQQRATRYTLEISVEDQSTADELAEALYQEAAVFTALHLEIGHRLDEIR